MPNRPHDDGSPAAARAELVEEEREHLAAYAGMESLLVGGEELR